MKQKINTKKAFAFSLLSLFLVFLIFAFGSLYLFQEDYSQQANYREARILFVNNEIDYFKKIYLKNALEFALYNSFHELQNYLKNNNKQHIISQNYSKLNDLIKEGIINGTFESTPIPNLDEKNLNYLVNHFADNFKENYKGNFTYNLKDLTIYETKSYYVNIQIVSEFAVTTDDKLSTWNFTDEHIIEIPVSGLADPEFLFKGNKNLEIRSSEFYLSNSNWSHYSFNESMLEHYSTVFYNQDFDYVIGKSYIQRLINLTTGSFYKVIGHFSFDQDELLLIPKIFDNAQNFKDGKLYGNSQMLYSFDSTEQTLTHIFNQLSYKKPLQKFGSVNCTKLDTVYQNYCEFNTTSDYLQATDSSKLFDFNENFSTSFWININNITTPIQTIFATEAFKIQLQYASNKHTLNYIYNSTSGLKNIQSNYTILPNDWYHIVTTQSNNQTKIYVNIINSENFSTQKPISTPIKKLILGKDFSNQNYKGKIDEFGIFAKVLTPQEIAKIHQERKIYQIDYVDSYFTKAINFDGKKVYARINHSNLLNLGTNDFSVCTWIKTPKEFSSNPIQQIFVKREAVLSNGNIELDFEESSKKLRARVNNKLMYFSTPLIEDKHYYICLSKQSGVSSLFLNGNLELSSFSNSNINSNSDIYLGMDPYEPTGEFFKGQIDELKIYGYAITQDQALRNYKNYQSFEKGCCNYITLVNQNDLGYTSSTYNKPVSSTSSIFFDYYTDGIFQNITLFESTNFTSNINSEYYYNFLVDDCILRSFNFLDYDPETQVPLSMARNKGAANTSECSDLIKLGIY